MTTASPTLTKSTQSTPLLPKFRWSAGTLGTIILLSIAVPCLLTLPWSLQAYNEQQLTEGLVQAPPSIDAPFGRDDLGRSLLWRCLLGGAISLGIGAAAATIAVVMGVFWGATAAYVGGRVDSIMMRFVDIMYGLPYILLVVMFSIALEGVMLNLGFEATGGWINVLTLLVAIGAVSWLTMARVIRGQVLSLREQQFIEAAKATGVGPIRVMIVHLLPNLVGPIIVYATLTVPQAILQESFLSFLGLGVQVPLPSWGNLAADGVKQLTSMMYAKDGGSWWLLLFPCLLLGLTLMALNFVGDALRDRFDPKSKKR